jgi:hypothetical protein
MTPDKQSTGIPKQEIPEEFENWISDWLKQNVISGPEDWQNHNAKVIWARAIAIDIYRHVSDQLRHSQQPSPVGEAGVFDRQHNKWVDVFKSYSKVAKGVKSELDIWSNLSHKYIILERWQKSTPPSNDIPEWLEEQLLYAQGMVDYSPKDREYWKGELAALVLVKEKLQDEESPTPSRAGEITKEEIFDLIVEFSDQKEVLLKGGHPETFTFSLDNILLAAQSIYRKLPAREISPVLPWLKDLIEMGEDGYKLHRSNAVHQEFLEEDRDTLRDAKAYLAEITKPIPPTPAPEVKEDDDQWHPQDYSGKNAPIEQPAHVPDPFIEWLDKEIEELDRQSSQRGDVLFQQSIVSSKAMAFKIKEKYITLTNQKIIK